MTDLEILTYVKDYCTKHQEKEQCYCCPFLSDDGMCVFAYMSNGRAPHYWKEFKTRTLVEIET